MKKNWLRTLIGGLSFTSALFVFQACYGTGPDYGLDLNIKGQVKSKTSGLPIEGIKVSVPSNSQFELTDRDGKFSFYTEWRDVLAIQFEDVDSTQNGLYASKDTVLAKYNRVINLNIALEEK
jgi:putative lipoprotein (rSAM/lipoprotein system)